MKTKYIISLGILTGIAIGMITESCTNSEIERRRQEMVKWRNIESINAEYIDSTGLKASSFTYQNHDFIHFFNAYGDEAIVHSPNCKFCFEIFD